MPIEDALLADFSGGEIDFIASTEPDDNQWSALVGFVLDNNRRIRSQWASTTFKINYQGTELNVLELTVLDDLFVAKTLDGGFSGWYWVSIDDALEENDWNLLDTSELEEGVADDWEALSVCAKLPLQVTYNDALVWVNSVLMNKTGVDGVNNFAIYRKPGSNPDVGILYWTEQYPNGTPTTNSMPYAEIGAMWKDFFILGNVVWKDDEGNFNSSQNAKYPHALWFSAPAKPTSWDPIDIAFIGQSSGSNQVNGIFPVDGGLLVTTTELVAFLKGTPDEFSYNELRVGVGPKSKNAVAYWGNQGGIVWSDKNDHIWFTNGDIFQRLDGPVSFKNAKSVSTWQDYVIIVDDNKARVLKMFDENGGWTTLVAPGLWDTSVTTSSNIFAIFFGDYGGTFLVGHNDETEETYALLADADNPSEGDNLLWGSSGQGISFDTISNARGTIDGKKIRPYIRSRPLPDSGHRTVFWHRFGVRASGDGTVRKAIARPSRDPEHRGLVTRLIGRLKERRDYIFDAHGPSLEATFEVEFEGDVTVEHMSTWSHGGTTER